MDLSFLNPAQQKAVKTTDGPMMLLAGAGSGKTRTLVSKIQYLVEEKGISAFRILALTFSNKAAKEMRQRINVPGGFDLNALQLTTFHAFCARLLRSEASFLGLSRSFTIYDTSESKTVAKSILAKRGISTKEINPNEVLYYIDSIKNLGHYLNQKEVPEQIDTTEPFYEYFCEYEMELFKSNAIDFGGLITGVLNLFENFPEVLERYQRRYHYLLVDEYQDTNRAQFKLLTSLAMMNKNICVVGDEDQSIYSWRGADINNILDFEKVYPDSRLIKLEQNYRSSKNIIEAAGHVIDRNIARKGKQMWTENNRGDSISVIECKDDRTEANFIGKEVKRLVADGVSPSDIAIFYRTNAQSRSLEDGLRQLSINYRVVAGIKFYERKEIKDITSYLRLVVNPKDNAALTRVINIPTRGIGTRTLRKIEDEAVKLGISLWEILVLIVEDYENYSYLKLSAKIKMGLAQFVNLVQEAQLLNDAQSPPSTIYEKILSESGYYESLVAEKSYEAQARIENLDEFLSAFHQYELEVDPASLTDFLENIALDSNPDKTQGEEVEEVSMMTIHGAKGLEYKYVFIAGVEESVFPSFQSVESGEGAIEEERRLFYVAMTRAMHRLYILFAQGRMLWGNIKFNAASRFLDEIPEEYYTLKRVGVAGKSVKNKVVDGVDYDDEFAQDHYQDSMEDVVYVTSKKIERPTYDTGTAVKHKIYGEGVVKSTDGLGVDEKVVIQFQNGASKKFLLKYAPIERIF